MCPVVEISSMPSAPCTTQARIDPSSRSERASRSVRSARGTPTTCRVAPAGFVSGPSRLNAVRTPISRRVGAACFIDGWNVGAKKNAMLPVRSARSTTAGAAARFTPSCSNTSALPQRLETDRLPCLATLTPHAATTIAAADEMLNVPARSPPVPQVSQTSPSGLDTLTACSRIARAKPTSSAGRSPFMRSADSSAASAAGAARPSMTSPMAAAASSVVRSS